MSFKTVELDDEAYEILSRQKRAGQSFSEIVKQNFRPKPHGTARDLLELAKKVEISEDTLDRIEEIIQTRSQNPPRDVDL
jgi:predicted CopG family antitoxin